MLVVLVGLVAAPTVASTATHVIELPKTIVFGVEGQEIDLGTFATPADLVGYRCAVSTSGNNNVSVHVGNDLLVTSADSVTLFGVEDAINKRTEAAGLLTLGDQITFTLVLGPDGIYSAEQRIEFDCQAPPTTTTTQPDDTSTTMPEVTTVPGETTTTGPPESDTTLPTTTLPEEPEDTTTTTGPEVGAETTTTASEPVGTLPFTGAPGSDQMAVLALLAIATGSGLVVSTRRSSETVESDRAD